MLGMLLSFPLAVYGMSVTNSFPDFTGWCIGKTGLAYRKIEKHLLK
jgi:hypothetical protein